MEKTARTGMPGLTVAPEREEFARLEGCTHAIIAAELSSDLETPVSAFIKLRRSAEEPCFLLESAESGRMWGRYSFLGFEPSLVASLQGGELVLEDAEGARDVVAGADPLGALFEVVEGMRVKTPGRESGRGAALPFTGGAVGYFGYPTFGLIEDVSLEKRPGVDGVPALMFMVPSRLVTFDHLRSRMTLCVVASLSPGAEDRGAAYDEAIGALEEMAALLVGSLSEGSSLALEATPPGDDFSGVESNVTRDRYEEMVSQAVEHIYAGDAFQIVVSQRFSMPFAGDALSIYRQLRAENPSPYMFYLQMPGLTLAGSSPEPMVTRRGSRALIRPIAGTRPRGADASEDAELAAELAADAKERAEHVMLVDLARNDLGRIAEPGTVRVSRMMEIEKYSHVMHMVSEVECALAEGSSNCDLLKASFPAGTVIGAPKVRASEIIESLEPDGRGPYAGAIGYISHSGDMDTCIAIRTVLVRDGTAYVQAGGGIVADSVPAREYAESRNKARAVVRAVRAAAGEENRRPDLLEPEVPSEVVF